MKKILTLCFLLMNCFLQMQILIAQNITLHLKPNALQGKDAFLSSFMPSTNFGNHPEFSGDAWTCSGSPCFGRNLIQFDLSSIPTGSIVNSATLSLYANLTPTNGGGIAMQGNNSSYLLRVISPWTESTVTWNTTPLVTQLNRVTIPQSTSSFQNYPSNDVTGLVQDMVDDPGNSFGFMLRLVNEVYYSTMIFASSDYSDSTRWPEITINYSPSVSRSCIVLKPDKDAFLSSSLPNTNYGNHTELAAMAWTCGGTPCISRGLLDFDLTKIPSHAHIVSALLSLYANNNPVNGGGVAMNGNNESVISRVTSSWIENSVTWNTMPSSVNLNAVNLAQSTSNFQDCLNINVRNLVQNMVDSPSTSFGFKLQLANEVYYASMIFASSDYPDSTSHPTLKICYTTTTVPTLSFWGLFIFGLLIVFLGIFYLRNK